MPAEESVAGDMLDMDESFASSYYGSVMTSIMENQNSNREMLHNFLGIRPTTTNGRSLMTKQMKEHAARHNSQERVMSKRPPNHRHDGPGIPSVVRIQDENVPRDCLGRELELSYPRTCLGRRPSKHYVAMIAGSKSSSEPSKSKSTTTPPPRESFDMSSLACLVGPRDTKRYQEMYGTKQNRETSPRASRQPRESNDARKERLTSQEPGRHSKSRAKTKFVDLS